MKISTFSIRGKKLCVEDATLDSIGWYHGKLHEEGKDNDKDIVIKNFDYFIQEVLE